MPGRGALLDISGVRSEIKSIQVSGSYAGAGAITGETSEIGGDGRRGSDAYDRLEDPTYTRIDAQIVGKASGDLATRGIQSESMEHSSGRTWEGGGRRRAED